MRSMDNLIHQVIFLGVAYVLTLKFLKKRNYEEFLRSFKTCLRILKNFQANLQELSGWEIYNYQYF